MESSPSARHTCLKLEIPTDDLQQESIFVKGTWCESSFDISITDGFHAWSCQASEAEVRQRAEQWDQPVAEYVALAERYLGFQQPGSYYRFEDAGGGHRRLSWTFEKKGTKLEWRWKCQPSANPKQTTAGILDFLMDANIRLSDEVVRKAQACEKFKVEAERCLSQSERLNKEKAEFESAVYMKFVAVLNSKKAKLRELRDKVSKLEAKGKAPEEEDDDKTESYDEQSDDDRIKEEPVEQTADDVPADSHIAASSSKGRKRKTHI